MSTRPNLDLTGSVFVAFNDCGKFGVEAVVDPTYSRAEVVSRMIRGEIGFDDVIRIVEFNAAEGWSREVTDDLFAEVEAQRELEAA